MPVSIDSVEGLQVEQQTHFNEIRSLQFLQQGLVTIANAVKKREQHYAELRKKMNFMQFGATSSEEEADLNLIACFFHWFGISAINYARLVGLIRGLETNLFTRTDLNDATKFKDISKIVKAYVESVAELANVLVWRNKVAGHFAMTDPRHDDNIATLHMSVMFPVSLENGVYYVGGLTMTMTNAAGIHESAIPMWSVTQVFDSLIPRYWPNIKFTKQESPTVKEQTT